MVIIPSERYFLGSSGVAGLYAKVLRAVWVLGQGVPHRPIPRFAAPLYVI